jgi:DnaK suppressor protein
MIHENAPLRLVSRLRSRRDALRKALDDDLGRFRQVSQETGVGDQADAAVDAASEEVSSQLAEIESRELDQIEHALQRIAVGVYGRCECCNQRIPAARLNALPYTNRCIRCQREHERCGTSMAPEPERWARIDDRLIEEKKSEVRLNRSDFEFDFRDTGHRSIDAFLV